MLFSELSPEAQQILQEYASWSSENIPTDPLPEHMVAPFAKYLAPLCNEMQGGLLWGEFEVPLSWSHPGIVTNLVGHIIVCRITANHGE